MSTSDVRDVPLYWWYAYASFYANNLLLASIASTTAVQFQNDTDYLSGVFHLLLNVKCLKFYT